MLFVSRRGDKKCKPFFHTHAVIKRVCESLLYVVGYISHCATFTNFIRIAGQLKCGQKAYEGDRILWVVEVQFYLRLKRLHRLCNIARYGGVVTQGANCLTKCSIIHRKSLVLLHRLEHSQLRLCGFCV